MSQNSERTVSARLLKPVRKYAATHRGAMSQIALKMSNKTGKPITRQQVEKWLCEDEQRRVEPGLGMGTLLIEIGDKLRGKKTK